MPFLATLEGQFAFGRNVPQTQFATTIILVRQNGSVVPITFGMDHCRL
jgi:hypothetical protein